MSPSTSLTSFSTATSPNLNFYLPLSFRVPFKPNFPDYPLDYSQLDEHEIGDERLRDYCSAIRKGDSSDPTNVTKYLRKVYKWHVYSAVEMRKVDIVFNLLPRPNNSKIPEHKFLTNYHHHLQCCPLISETTVIPTLQVKV